MTAGDDEWRRPGSQPGTEHRGLIDPAEHAPPGDGGGATHPSERLVAAPSSPSRTTARSADHSEPDHLAPDEPGLDEPGLDEPNHRSDADRLDVGRPPRPGRSRRRGVVARLVTVVLVLALSAGGTAGAVALLDTRRTASQDDLANAITSFRPSGDSETQVQSADEVEADGGYLPEPAGCAGLVLVAPAGAQGGASWYGSASGSNPSINVRAVRFGDPAAARAVVADLRSALPRCRTITFDPTSPERVTFGLTPVGRTGVLARRDRLSYLLTDERVAPTSDPAPGPTTGTPEPVDEDEPDFEIYVRRAGNVVIWGVGPQTEFETVTRAAVDDLTRRLLDLAAS